jgi:hypothetical protein
MRCKGSCPAAGGSVSHTYARREVTVTLSFDGSADASYSTSTGLSGHIPLACGLL